ncbi:MAG: PTS sugar transporter subunit IIB [Sporolactobacillus sp.]
MKKVMLVCAAGMSTSLLVTKMQKAAQKNGDEDLEIFARSTNEATPLMQEGSIQAVLIGPQVKYMEKKFKEILEEKNIPIESINMMDYGMMNGEKILAQAKRMLG